MGDEHHLSGKRDRHDTGHSEPRLLAERRLVEHRLDHPPRSDHEDEPESRPQRRLPDQDPSQELHGGAFLQVELSDRRCDGRISTFAVVRGRGVT